MKTQLFENASFPYRRPKTQVFENDSTKTQQKHAPAQIFAFSCRRNGKCENMGVDGKPFIRFHQNDNAMF